jgi:hypothetical protein
MIKVIPEQFVGLPSLAGLVRPYGDFTLFDVLWNFMGSSAPYTIFTGVVEVVAALLLLFRRTTTLGALLAAGALLNVAALDFSYGVPEKLDVIHLVAMVMIVLAPDLPRLANVLLLNRPAVPIDAAGRPDAQPRIGGAVVKIAIVAYVLVTSTLMPFRFREEDAAPGPLFGIYDVVTFEANGRTLEPLTTDPVRWRRIVFVSEEDASVEMMDDSWHHFNTRYQPRQASVQLMNAGHSRGALHYDRDDAGAVQLRGTFGDETVGVTLARVDESQFRLRKSRFRWINGEP